MASIALAPHPFLSVVSPIHAVDCPMLALSSLPNSIKGEVHREGTRIYNIHPTKTGMPPSQHWLVVYLVDRVQEEPVPSSEYIVERPSTSTKGVKAIGELLSTWSRKVYGTTLAISTNRLEYMIKTNQFHNRTNWKHTHELYPPSGELNASKGHLSRPEETEVDCLSEYGIFEMTCTTSI
jgi:hypothetical protein